MTAPTEQHDTARNHPAPCNWDGGANCTCPPEVTGEVLDSDAPDNGGWDKERHCATDLRGVNWAGAKLREAQDQIFQNLEMHHAEVDTLRLKIAAAGERLSKANAPFHRTSLYMENAIRVFAETHRDEVLKGLRTKSRTLPCGVTVGWEKKGGHIRLQEAPDARERLISWARQNCPETTEERWEVDVQAVKRAISKAVVPAGMERVPVSEELYVVSDAATTKGESK